MVVTPLMVVVLTVVFLPFTTVVLVEVLMLLEFPPDVADCTLPLSMLTEVWLVDLLLTLPEELEVVD